jgi:hypothetical protein
MKSLLYLILLFSLNAVAQDSTKVRFFVKGGEKYFVRIDGELQPQTNILSVAKGTHEVEIWSFKKRAYRGKLETGNLDSTNFFAELLPSPEYVSYLRENDNYKRKLFFAKTAPFIITGISAIALPFVTVRRFDKHEELVQNQFLFDRQQITSETMDNTKLQYNVVNTLFYVSAIGTVVGSASFFLLRPYANKLMPPTFKQQNPFTLEYMNLTYNQQVHSKGIRVSFV